MTHKIVVGKDSEFLLICCLFCFFFFFASPLSAKTGVRSEENNLVAIGTGAVIDGNVSMAKKVAVSRALMKGIEDYLLYRLGSRAVVNNFQRFANDVIPGAKEGIENFHILAESQIGDKYKVLVRLKINKRVIDEKIRKSGLTQIEGPPIKVLFLISETRRGRTFFWWEDPEIHAALRPVELALHKSFQDEGFTPINRTLIVPDADYSKDMRSPELKNNVALEWGRLFSADVVIAGQTRIVEEKEVSLTLRALDVNQGGQICHGTHIEPVMKGPDGKEQTAAALEKVVNRLVAILIPRIIQIALPDHERMRNLDVTLTGLKTHRQFMDFRDFLRNNITGVKSVKQVRVRKDSTSIEVKFQGDENRFVDHVLNHKNLPFSLDFDQTEEGEILFNIIE